jgi:hypothetical protein
MLPKAINNKISFQLEQNKEGKFNQGGKQIGKMAANMIKTKTSYMTMTKIICTGA